MGAYTQAQVTLTWNPVTVNADGTAAEDVDHYELFQRPFGSVLADRRHFADTTETIYYGSPYVAGSNWYFSVRAVDTSGNRGALSNETAVGMATDATPPQAPSQPTVTSRLGTLSVSWDGFPASGVWPGDFAYVEVHRSTVNNFTPSASTLIDSLFSKGVSVITGAAFGVPLYVRLVAVDTSDLKSSPSVQGVGTPTRLVGSDLDPGAITYEQISFKDPGNIVPDGSFETESGRAQLLANSNSAWTFTSAEQFHGSWSATLDGSVNASTTRQLVLMRTADAQQILPTEKLFVRMAYKCSAGADGTLQTVVQWIMTDGSLTSSTITASLKNGTWQQAAAQLTAPSGVRSFRIFAQLTSSGTTGQNYIDVVEVRRTVGTAIIQDAAIQNAQIDNLAVNSAKISDLEVGKLTAGQLNADILVAARIRTATSGSRVEMSATGIRMYKGTSVTGHWNPAVGQLRIYSTTDLSHTSSGHGFQIGDDNTFNLAFDNNELMARFNGTYSTFFLNREGGSVVIGGKKGGFADDGSDQGTIPANDDQRIVLVGAVEVQNDRDGDYGDPYSPFMVGPRNQQHLWFDTNEFGSSSGAGVSDININPPRRDGSYHASRVIMASSSIKVERNNDTVAAIGGHNGPTSGLQFYQDELRVTNNAFNAYRGIKASAFTVSSSASVKQDVSDIADPLGIVLAAPSRRWRYLPSEADDQAWHYGPMLEDLPTEMHRDSDGSLGLDIDAKVGVLWEALRQLAKRQDGS